MDTTEVERPPSPGAELVQATSAPPSPSTDTLELLHAEARRALHEGVTSFGLLEQKVGRHLTLLAILLGAFAVSLPNALETWMSSSGFLARLFSGAYVGLAVATFAGLFCLMRALGYTELWDDPIDKEFIDRYGPKEYETVLVALARGAVESVRKNKTKRLTKVKWALRGYMALWFVFAFALVTVVCYVAIVVG